MNQDVAPQDSPPSKVSDLRRIVPLLLIALALVVPYLGGGKELMALPIMITLLGFSALMIISSGPHRSAPPLIIAWSVLAGSVVLSSVITPRITTIVGELLLVGGFGLAMWVMIQLTDSEATRVRLGMVLAGAVLAIIGIVGLISQSTAYGTLISTFYNSNAIAGYLVILTGIAVAVAVTGTNRISRVLYGAAAVLFLYSIYLTQSRGAWIAIGVGAVVMTLLLLRRKRDRPWARGQVLVMVAVAVVLIGAAAAVGLGVQPVREQLAAAAEDEPRLDYWAASIQLGAISPVLGGGTGTFEYRYPEVQTSVLSFSRTPHSKFFKSMAEGGIVGVSAFLMFAVVGVWVGWMACLKSSEEYLPLYLGGLLGFTAFLVHGVIDFQWFFPATAMLAFMSLGLLGRGLSREVTYSKGIKASIAVGTVLLLGAGVLHYQSAAAAEGAGLYAGLGNLDSAESSLNTAVMTDPTASLPHLYMGLNHLQRARKGDSSERERYFQLAREEIDRAIALDRLNPQNYASLGQIELAAAAANEDPAERQELLDNAVRAFETAYGMDKWNRPEISLQLADAAEAAGDMELSQLVLRQTIDRYPDETLSKMRSWFGGGMSITEADELIDGRPDLEVLLGKYSLMVKAVSRSHFRLARQALEAGDTESAILHATRAFEVDETNFQAEGMLEELKVEPKGG